MNNADAWSSVEFYSSELTKFARQLGFAAAALCWLFRESSDGLPRPASVALVLLVLFFIFDILQFFVSFHVHRKWMYEAEAEMLAEQNTLDGDYQKPQKLDKPAFLLFNAKIAALTLAFVALGVQFSGLLFRQ